MSDIQFTAMTELRKNYLNSNPGPADDRVSHWNEARETATPFLSEEQVKRIDQIALQRMTYRAFLAPDVVEKMKLSQSQQEQVQNAIARHLDRIQENRSLPIDERGRAGRQSHRQVWLDIRDILTATQVKQFNDLRGTKPE